MANDSNTCSIIRKSIFTLLQNYQYFTSTPTLLAFPYAASYLLTQSLATSSHLFPLVDGCLRSLFLVARFPSSSWLFSILNLKLSQTLTTFLLVSPFSFTFLLLAKASVIIHHRKSKCSHRLSSLFTPLLITQLCSSLVLLTANAVCFFSFAFCFNFLAALGLSSSQGPTLLLSVVCAVIYCIVVANAYTVCSFASVLSGMENRGGLVSILEAWNMIQGRTRTATALSLNVAMEMSLAAVEALFQYRVARAYPNSGFLVMEGVLIAFMYALLLVLDTVVGCVYWSSCKKDDHIDQQREITYLHTIEMAENSRP